MCPSSSREPFLISREGVAQSCNKRGWQLRSSVTSPETLTRDCRDANTYISDDGANLFPYLNVTRITGAAKSEPTASCHSSGMASRSWFGSLPHQ